SADCLPFCVLISATSRLARLKTIRAICLIQETSKAISGDFVGVSESGWRRGRFVRRGMTIAHLAIANFSALYLIRNRVTNIRRKHMAYDDEQATRSRVVVDTPTSRREVTHTEAVRNDRGGMSGATVGVIVVVAIALITVVVLFLMNGQQNANLNDNLAAQQQQPVIVQQPAQQQQPPVIIQQPAAAPVANQPPVIINQPAS